MPNIEIYQGAGGLFHWRVKDEDGEILCWSKGYKTPESARRAARATEKNGRYPVKSELKENYSPSAKWKLEKY